MISEASTLVFNLKPCDCSCKISDEIHTPRWNLSPFFNVICMIDKTTMFVLDVHWKKNKNTQKEILKPDESLSLLCVQQSCNKADFSQGVRQILGFDKQFLEAAN